MTYFNDVFVGVCRLIADVDADVKNGAALFDRLLREIVVEFAASGSAERASSGFAGSNVDVTHRVVPLLRAHMGVSNPYVRQLLVGWISALDSVPGIDMLDHLGDLLAGLFDMLADGNREVRHAAHATLGVFLNQIDALGPNDFAVRLQLGAIVGTMLAATEVTRDRFVRSTAYEWLTHFIALGRTRLSPWYPKLAAALLLGLSDPDPDLVKDVAKANTDLMLLVRSTPSSELGVASFANGSSSASIGSGDKSSGNSESAVIGGLLRAVQDNLSAEDRLTRSASLRWLSMLLQQSPGVVVDAHFDDVLSALLANLVDTTDVEVLKLDLEVIARLAATDPTWQLLGGRVLRDLVRLLGEHRSLLESKAAFIIRRLCLLLDPAVVYRALAALVSKESNREFAALMIELLNLILLTATELADFRDALRGCAAACEGSDATEAPPPPASSSTALTSPSIDAPGSAYSVYTELFTPWTVNPIAAISLVLLVHSHEAAARLVGMLSEMQITVGVLMQIDKLVQLLESPVFLDLRLSLLAPPATGAPAVRAAHLLTALFGILMILPQGTAYATLRDRLTAVTALLSVRGKTGSAVEPTAAAVESVASVRAAGVAALEAKISAARKAQRSEREAMSLEIRSRSVVHEAAASAPPLELAAAAPAPPRQLPLESRSSPLLPAGGDEVEAEKLGGEEAEVEEEDEVSKSRGASISAAEEDQ